MAAPPGATGRLLAPARAELRDPFCLGEPLTGVFPAPLFTLNHSLCYLPGGNYFLFDTPPPHPTPAPLKNINAIKIIRDLAHPFVYTVACHSDRHNINS